MGEKSLEGFREANPHVTRVESKKTQRTVADAAGVARSVIARLFNRFQETRYFRRRPRQGLPHPTTTNNDRYVLLTAYRDRTSKVTQIQKEFLLVTGQKVSRQTIRNRLHAGYLADDLMVWTGIIMGSRTDLHIIRNGNFTSQKFVEWAQNEIAVVPDFHKRILFSDEAHFWLNGYVNKHNCRIWSEANPQVYVETALQPEKLTVWCALWAGGIIGPYCFKTEEGHNITVHGDRYRAMIINFFIPELNNHDVQELWFQQDGATCHTARATIDLLKDTFGDRLISRFGPVNWPPRSCDLTPLDYFLWGYVKSLVYADKLQTPDHLEDNIRRVIADIRPQMLEKVIENWTSRLDYIRASRGSHMPEIMFKM
ncbi:putative transposable element [Trichonephila clavipes]|nr:putative transposable element [Trichonephila clavipes]